MVNAKPHEKTLRTANRIQEMDVDVIVVQEVADIHVMKFFNKEISKSVFTSGHYRRERS